LHSLESMKERKIPWARPVKIGKLTAADNNCGVDA
jgi:hypothetical protein